MTRISTAERIPLPPFPSGWYAVASSPGLEAGQVLQRQYFGRELVLYRTASGEPHLADAYCPHLGAHLGHGGRVEGERLVCPFHNWQFGSDGRCEAMPYGKRIPASARLRTHEVLEQDGMVLAWWGGTEGAAPHWKPPVVGLTRYTDTRSQSWTLPSHPQEIMENSADGAHFRYIHKTHYMAVAEGPACDTTAYDIVFETDPEGVVAADRAPHGTPDLRYHVIVHGPGVVYGFMEPGGASLGTLSRVYVTPIDGEHVEMRVTSNVTLGGDGEDRSAIADAIASATFEQVDDDTPIWSNKRYRPTPALNEEEVAIVKFRRWFSQFYPEASAS